MTGTMKKTMLIAVLVSMCGCVDREMTITSEPSGARVEISGLDVGTTPLRKNFTWYGVYDVVISKDGYETRRIAQNVPLPSNQIPPLDLFLELWPATIYDRHAFHYRLEPAKIPTREQLVRQADVLRIKNDQKFIWKFADFGNRLDAAHWRR